MYVPSEVANLGQIRSSKNLKTINHPMVPLTFQHFFTTVVGVLLGFSVAAPLPGVSTQMSAVASVPSPYVHEQWYINDLSIRRIWQNYATGTPNVVVAVIDDGVDIYNPNVAGNIWTKDESKVIGLADKYKSTYVKE